MSDISKQIITKNPFHYILENEEIDNFLTHTLYTRSLNQYARPPKIFQDLSVSLSLISNILEILRIEKLSYYELSNSKDQKFVIYSITFEFLRIVCINNQKVKAQVYEEMKFLIESMEPNCETFIKYFFFFEEFVIDNPLIIQNTKLVQVYVESFLYYILNSEDINCSQSCFLLRILPKMIKCNGAVNKDNQQIVLSHIFDNRFTSIFGQFRGDKLYQFLKNIVPAPKTEVFKETGDIYGKEGVFNDSRIRFIGAYFSVLIACVENTNPLLQKFCQNVYSLDFFNKIFMLRIWNLELNTPILKLMIELYLKEKESSKISLNFMIEEFLDDFLMDNFKDTVDRYVGLSKSSEEDFIKTQLINEEGFLPMTSIQEQYIDCILVIIQKIISTELSDLSFNSFANKHNNIVQKFIDVTKDTLPFFPPQMRNRCKNMFSVVQARMMQSPPKQNKSYTDFSAKEISASSANFANLNVFERRRSTKNFIGKQVTLFDYNQEQETALKPVVDQINLILRDDKLISHYESNFEKICKRLSTEEGNDPGGDKLTVERVGCALIQSLCVDPNMDNMNSRMYLFCFKWLRFYLNESRDGRELIRRQVRRNS